MGIKSIPFKSTPERMVQAEMKKRRVRRWFLAVFAVLLIILLYIVISFLRSDKRFLTNDLQNSWNSSIQCSDDQIDFAYHDSYSTDAYYVLQGENVRLNLSDSTSNPEATYQYVRIEGNGTFSEIQMQMESAQIISSIWNVFRRNMPRRDIGKTAIRYIRTYF